LILRRAVDRGAWPFGRPQLRLPRFAVSERLRGFRRRFRPAARRSAGLLWAAVLELISLVVAGLLAPLFYWRLLRADPLDAATLPPGDITELHYPYRRWVAEQLARGEPPWWNQFVSAGHSAIGDIQFHTLYPLDNWLAGQTGAAFPFPTFELGIVGHVALGSVFMYLLARRLTGSRSGGLVAAIIFGFGGYLAGFPVQQIILLETSIWLPLVLLLIDVGADYNLVSAFAVGAGALALAALAGHPQTLFYVGTAAVIYLLFKAWGGGRPRFAAVLGLPVLVLGGVALAAQALLPAYFHLALTDRTAVSYSFSSGGFGLHEALGLVFPVDFGGAALYDGLFTLVLAAVGLASRYRRSNKLFWVGFGALGLLFSFGSNTFLQGIEYLALGSFKFRDHERLAFFVGISLAILAGYGAAELSRPQRLRLRWLRRSITWPIIAVVGLLALLAVGYATGSNDARGNVVPLIDRAAYSLVVLALGAGIVFGRERGVVSGGMAGLLAVLLVGFDLFSTNWQDNLRPGDPSMVLGASPIVEYLQSYTTGQYRISSEGLLPGDGNAGALFRLEDIVGNSPLTTRDYTDFDQHVPELIRWEVLNVRYAVTKRKLDDPRFRLLRQDGDATLYELDSSLQLPRSYVVSQAVLAPDHQAALALLRDVDLRHTAVVEGTMSLPSGIDTSGGPSVFGPAPAPSAAATTAVTSTVRVVDDQANGVRLAATLIQPGLVVLSEIDYPGWQATVDGSPTPIFRTDGIVRSVYVPRGEHEIQFTFAPVGLALGTSISSAVPLLLRDLVVLEIALRLLWLAAALGIRLMRTWRERRRVAQAPVLATSNP
jgi:Bacterial membrane protein YfhO